MLIIKKGIKPLSSSYIVTALVLLSILMLWVPADAHYPGVVLTGFSTATIDGVLSPGEWDNAGKIDFSANIPLQAGGGTAPATLLVMNDGANLYFALKIKFVATTLSAFFEFDNNHNGLWPEEGDDAFGVTIREISSISFYDDFRTSNGFGLLDSENGGTTDGMANASADQYFTYIEISHPLNSQDDLHDFNLAPGDIVGFRHELRMFSIDSYADTYFPPTLYSPEKGFYASYGNIAIAWPSPAVNVSLDIAPGVCPSPLYTNSSEPLPIAILGTDDLDVGKIDVASIKLEGRAPVSSEYADVGKPISDPFACYDQGTDGVADLLVSFDTQHIIPALGDLKNGEVRVLTLTGRLKEEFGGYQIRGEDVVVVLEENGPPPKVVLRNPDGGEAIPSGSLYTVRYLAVAELSQFRLQYSVNNGRTWRKMHKERYLTRLSYDWQVPTKSKNETMCLVKVTAYNTSGKKVASDQSRYAFATEVVRLTYPNGNEILNAGIAHPITWRVNNTVKPVGKVSLYQAQEEDGKWKLITTLADNTGTYDGWIPNVYGRVKIQIVLRAKNGRKIGSDISDDYFTVISSP